MQRLGAIRGMVARYAASVHVEDGAIARYFGNGGPALPLGS